MGAFLHFKIPQIVDFTPQNLIIDNKKCGLCKEFCNGIIFVNDNLN
jgi:hypothetical protein